MSKETSEWLNNNILRGFTAKRGTAWWNREGMNLTGMDNHYPGAIPADDIVSRLFNWTALQRSVYVDGGAEFGMIHDPSRKAWMRSDNGAILGLHSDSYAGHDYREWLIDNLSKLVGTEAQFANAGLLKEGAIAWVQIELPENIDIPGGVTMRPFLMGTTSFNGSLATTFKTGATDVVCDNTHGMFMSEAGEKYKRKHSRYSAFDVMDAATAVGTLHMIAETMTRDVTRLLDVDVSDNAWSRFVEAHVPIMPGDAKRSVTMSENKRQALTGLWRTDSRVAPWSGTAWGVVQAVNTYNEHLAIVRNAVRMERKFTRAVKDEVASADRETVITLGKVIGRDLLNA